MDLGKYMKRMVEGKRVTCVVNGYCVYGVDVAEIVRQRKGFAVVIAFLWDGYLVD